MAFKVAGRSPSGGSKNPPGQKPSTNATDQQSFAFKSSSPVKASPSAPRPASPRPAAITPPASQMRRPAPAAPSKPAAQPLKADRALWHGRSEAPPPRGSSYAEYCEWSADGLIPDKYTDALALDYYLGIRPDEPEETATFRP